MTYDASDFLERFGPLRLNERSVSKNSTLKHDEIIAIFLNDPYDGNLDNEELEIRKLNGKKHSGKEVIPPENRRKCSFDPSIQLWKALDIHTLTHGGPVIGGSVSKVTVASDIPVEFALNFNIPIPDEYDIKEELKYTGSQYDDRKPVIIAVLDTGVDQDIPKEFLWSRESNADPIRQEHRKKDPEYGQSFTGDGHIWKGRKDHKQAQQASKASKAPKAPKKNGNDQNEHGTLVSLYIINEFLKKGVPVKLMVLKTHDEKGEGDLYTIYQAVQFAINNGAHIINASWGFYSYLDKMGELLKKWFADKLREKNILLITAAGNKIDAVDTEAIENFQEGHPGESTGEWSQKLSDGLLRNLEIHNFFPACLSNDTGDDKGNVITVTTVFDNEVSNTQNYSNKHVDIGINADSAEEGRMVFGIPFQESGTASGSSYATAIATGIIGANVVSGYINSGDPVILTKEKVLEDLSSITLDNDRLKDKIKMGREVAPADLQD